MAGKQVERYDDPHGAHYFALEINNTQIAHFLECSGLKTTSTVFEIEEGGLNGLTYKRPGQSKWENIVLRYATSTSFELVAWRDKFLNDQFNYQENHGAIVMYDNAHNEVRRFSFRNAWPVSWEGPSLNAGSSELAVETLEISHEGLTVSAGSR